MAEVKRQNFMHGAAILTAGVVVMKILGAIYKIPLQHVLGDVGYGYFFTAYAIYNMLLTVSTAGLPVALSRMISEANTLGRAKQARRTFRIALGTLAVLGVVFSALMFFFPTEMAILMVSKPEVSQSVFALSPAVLLVCLTSAFRGYIQGNGNMTPTTVGQVLEVLVKVIVGLALSIWLTRRHAGLPVAVAGAIFGVSMGAAAALVYMYLCYRKQYAPAALAAIADSNDVPDGVGQTLRQFIRIGLVITVGASVMSLISLLDMKLLQSTLPTVPAVGRMADDLIGSYSNMQTLYNLPASFITPMTIAVVPAISAAAARRARAEVSEIAESGLRVSAVVAMPMGVGLAVLSEPIVGVIYRDTNPIGPVILRFLGVAAVFVCITLVTNAILQADGNERMPILSMIAGGAVKIACNLILVRIPEINILGAAIGTIGCYAVICVLNCFFIARRLEKKPRYDRAFLRPLLSTAAMGAAAWAVYGILSRLLHVPGFAAMTELVRSGHHVSRLPMLLAMCCAIGAAVIVYLVMIIVTRSITREDLKLIPKGDKLANLLRLR